MDKEIHVVAALFKQGDTVFVQQRPAHKPMPLLWEFPGGKIEPHETPAQALARECFEELGVHIFTHHVYAEVVHDYPSMKVRLTVLEASLQPESLLQPKACAQWAWVHVSELHSLTWCEADIPVVEKIMQSYTETHNI
jgi:mutator protein MutT